MLKEEPKNFAVNITKDFDNDNNKLKKGNKK